MLRDQILLEPFTGVEVPELSKAQKKIIIDTIKSYFESNQGSTFETFAKEVLSPSLINNAITIYQAQMEFHAVCRDITGSNYVNYDLPRSYSVNYVISQLSRIRKENKSNELLQLGGYLPKDLKQARKVKQENSLKTQSTTSLQLSVSKANQVIKKSSAIISNPMEHNLYELSLSIQILTGRRFWEIWGYSKFMPYSDNEIIIDKVAKSKNKEFLTFPVLSDVGAIIDAVNNLRDRLSELGVSFENATDRNKYAAYHESTTVYALYPELQIKVREYGKHSKRGEPYSCRKFYAAYCLKFHRPSHETIHSYLKKILGHENDNTQRHYSNLIIN